MITDCKSRMSKTETILSAIRAKGRVVVFEKQDDLNLDIINYVFRKHLLKVSSADIWDAIDELYDGVYRLVFCPKFGCVAFIDMRFTGKTEIIGASRAPKQMPKNITNARDLFNRPFDL